MDTSKGSVKKLNEEDIRRISTSQVIASLSGACRELIDNALDAGATNIEIRAVEFGVKQLEVIDNGSGVSSSNFEALAKPHSTSKLTSLSDFEDLLTFGFRGEALNSLAALCDLTVITRHKDEPTATRLKFDSHGEIAEQTTCARPTGTTVILSNMFEPLKVRRKQFIATSREQFQKLLNGVQAFALSRSDVRFCVKNTVGTKSNPMLMTQGGKSTLKSVISNLFGARADKQSMLEIKDAEPDNEILGLYGLPLMKPGEDSCEEIKISGYVSSCLFGQGRSSGDRQFVFVNGRPVDYSKMCKVVNEVYGKYIDVNVTPDKRQVFLRNEKEAFAKLRACLLATFQEVVGSCPVSRIMQETQTQLKFDSSANNKENANRLPVKVNFPKNAGPSKVKSPPSASTSSKASPPAKDHLLPSVTTFDRPLSTMMKRPAGQRLSSPKAKRNCIEQEENSNEPCCSHNTTPIVDLSLSQGAENPFDTTVLSDDGTPNLPGIALSTDIQEESQMNVVEQRLSLMLKKDDFFKMTVIGQFNKAFILTRLGQDLFIIDQHAADEKYNFERLQQLDKIEYQSLIQPKRLDVGAIFEAVISENLNIFRANGFDFEFREEELPGRRIRLLAVPSLRGHVFGQSDIEEIAGVLNAYPGTMYRPEKIRKIYASRACRTSIMVGDALKQQQMVRIVRQMATIDNPWNCPHGRPTIRHLGKVEFDLLMPQIFQSPNAEDKNTSVDHGIRMSEDKDSSSDDDTDMIDVVSPAQPANVEDNELSGFRDNDERSRMVEETPQSSNSIIFGTQIY